MITVDIKHRSFEETLLACEALGGVDLIVTSPPYCDARTASAYGTAEPWREEQYKTLGDACFSALKPSGHAIVNVDAPIREWRAGFGTERGFHAWRMMLDWAERVGFRVPDRLAFGRHGLPGAYSGRFRNDWEPLLWFQKPGTDGYFNKEILDAPSPYGGGGVTTQRRADGTMYSRVASGAAVDGGITRRGTLWSYGGTGHGQSGSADLEATGHPARYPLRLALDVVACFSPDGGLVCDPFVGSGTSAVACAMLKRNVIGGDIGARESDGRRWADIALERAMAIVDPAQRSLFT
jgi:DNA modification methylase